LSRSHAGHFSFPTGSSILEQKSGANGLLYFREYERGNRFGHIAIFMTDKALIYSDLWIKLRILQQSDAPEFQECHFNKQRYMKRIFYLVVFYGASILGQAGFAQDATYGDFRAYVGINNTSGSNFSEGINGILHDHSVEGQLGYTIGISGTFGNHFYLAPGLYYSAMKAETTATSDIPGASEFKGETTINTISVPVRVGFRMLDVNHSGVFNLRLFGGILGSHVLGVSDSGDEEVSVSKEDFTDFSLSGQVGFGVDILIAFIDFGYDLGLTDFYKQAGTQKANQFFVNAGVRF
jgi:hypothetical protein